MKLNKIVILLVILALLPLGATAKKKDKKDKPLYRFKIETEVKRTPVKNQYRTGTCWCFATISFLESEALRKGKDETDLSEMYIVRRTYPHKAVNYLRLHGDANFSQGGQSHDVFKQMRRYGLVPESVYSGMRINEKRHNHGEMVQVMSGMMDGVLKRRGSRITPRWLEALEAVLDVYLGAPPKSFTYKGKTYTPESFAKDYLGLNADDYIEITSYTHQPFYKKFRLELPDNWDYDANYYNVPMKEFEAITDHALKNGYSVVWDGDVSERDFSGGRTRTSHGSGYAIVPEKDYEDKTRKEKGEKPTKPVKEKEITPELRQQTFDNWTTTDDHLMHFVGIAKDQNGNKYYLTKNSGGPDNAHGGYIYMSRAYHLLKATAITIHKDALSPEMKKKLKL